MNAWIGWALAAAALAAGYLGYGWRGLLLALSAIVFWMLLQFSRSLRVLRQAAQRPVGTVASAVMLNAKLQVGLRLPDVIRLAGSLGRAVSETPEVWAWDDAGGAEVQVTFQRARCARWMLVRRDADAAP
jgi:Flp pilus assembly protein TadB